MEGSPQLLPQQFKVQQAIGNGLPPGCWFCSRTSINAKVDVPFFYLFQRPKHGWVCPHEQHAGGQLTELVG
jgi:hypothetical protein